MDEQRELSAEQGRELIGILKNRFEKNAARHFSLTWADVQSRLEASPAKLWSLNEMERTGGEPDVVGRDEKKGEILFFDCSPETPAGRRNLCYDRAALDARKEHKPKTSAIDTAVEMGVDILSEEQYRFLQTLGKFDTKTSSWLLTPTEIRQLGGAIFGDRRYDRVFIYHNGADSYYGVRGFRGCLKV
ncbi:hypothetical protein hrd7_12010 [Leptolinea sp. HRD-7]|nr:hypothetical protein hrd7_12010 [Leptolinea sp. HRD-7]